MGLPSRGESSTNQYFWARGSRETGRYFRLKVLNGSERDKWLEPFGLYISKRNGNSVRFLGQSSKISNGLYLLVCGIRS
jgi:hypothetical protein